MRLGTNELLIIGGIIVLLCGGAKLSQLGKECVRFVSLSSPRSLRIPITKHVTCLRYFRPVGKLVSVVV